MVKRIYKTLFVLVLGFLFMASVGAASTCSYARQNELSGIAYNVKINVIAEDVTEEVEGQNEMMADDYDGFVEVTYKAFFIQLLNLTDDIYVEVTNKANNEKHTYQADDFDDGTLKFVTSNSLEAINYEINIFSNDSECRGELLRKHELVTPKINRYYGTMMCEGADEYYWCREVIDGNRNLSEPEIIKNIEAYKAGTIDKEGNVIEEEVKKPVKKSIYLIIGGSVVVAGVGVVILVKYMKRRKREI